MNLSQTTINQVKNFINPALNAGLLSREEYEEVLQRITANGENTNASEPKRKRLLTKKEFAQRRSVSPSTINRWIRHGWLDFERTPTAGTGYGHVLIREDAEPKQASNNE